MAKEQIAEEQVVEEQIAEEQIAEEQKTQKCYHIIVSVFNRKNSKTGYPFKAYATKVGKTKEGKDKWADVAFTNEVAKEDLPQNDCELLVPANMVNKATKNGYDRFWIHGWTSKFDLEKPIEDLSQYFEETEEDLPF